MGLIDDLTGRPTYLDANIFIYLWEGVAKYRSVLQPLPGAIAHGTITITTSELTLAEVLVGPLQKGRYAEAHIYERYLQTRPHFAVEPVTRTVLIEAARVRATTTPRLKLPDAIHVATALQHGCDVLLTNDHRLRTVPGLDVRYLDDYASP